MRFEVIIDSLTSRILHELFTMLSTVHGNLLESGEQVIAHQLNCVSRSSAGLATQIFDKYPYANVYSGKYAQSRTMGTVLISEPFEEKDPTIIGIVAQQNPGRPAKSGTDTEELRLKRFKQALFQLRDRYNRIAMPHGIGCGLAGGNWDLYSEALSDFAQQSGVQVVLYKLD